MNKIKKILESQFWELVEEWQVLCRKRMRAIKNWNVPEVERLESLIDRNNQKSNEIIEQLKYLS